MLSKVVFFGGLAALTAAQAPQLTVETTTGTVTGLINGTTPSVRQFLSIPFAQPPVGSLRWLPPQALKTNSSQRIDATRYPPSCPQFLSAVPSVYNQDIPPWIPYRYDQPAAAGASLQTSSEDCLYLGIWTPTNATKTSSLPVLFFITGGAFLTNGVDVPAQIPNHWVERTRSHIVVTINYRLNIFGYACSLLQHDVYPHHVLLTCTWGLLADICLQLPKCTYLRRSEPWSPRSTCRSRVGSCQHRLFWWRSHTHHNVGTVRWGYQRGLPQPCLP